LEISLPFALDMKSVGLGIRTSFVGCDSGRLDTGVMSKLRLAAVALKRACIVRSASCFVGRAVDVVLISQAMPAAFMGSARCGCCEADVRADLKPLFSEVLNVVRIVFLLWSRLGLREVCFGGTFRLGAADKGREYGNSWGTLLARSFNVSELRLV
jgi:hypothetical protein